MTGLQALERELRAPAGDGLRQLSDGDLTTLAEAIRTARQRQAAELEAAGDAALGLIPRMLRGPIRRMFS